MLIYTLLGFPGGSVVKNLLTHAGVTGDECSTLGQGRSPRVRNGNLLQYSCLGSSMDREAQCAAVPVITKSWTQLNN